jgi:hypothetical protein
MEKPMNVANPKVLLIGETTGGHSPLSNRLRKLGCDCRFTIFSQQVWRLLANESFDLILGPIRWNGHTLYPLIERLDGSGTTLFYSQAVEDSCLWLPALRQGLNCFGSAALHPREFVTVLDETIHKIRSIIRIEIEPEPARESRLSNSIVNFPGKVPLSAMAVTVKGQSLVACKSVG